MPATPSSFSSPQSPNRGQAVSESFSPLHPIIISLIATVGGYVLFQYQSKKLSLFDEHGNIMRAVFVILFLYAMALMSEYKLQNLQNQPTYLPIIKRFTPLIGLLVVVLLLLILSLFLGLAASIIWSFLVVEPTIGLLQESVQWLHVTVVRFRTSHIPPNNIDREESDTPGIQENELPF